MFKLLPVSLAASLATLVGAMTLAPAARADIFQWEYVNTANPGQGKQPSATLAPDGSGANVVQGANLSNRNLTKAYLIGGNLSALPWGGGEFGDDFFPSNLNGVNLSQADLTNANLTMAWLVGANLTGAEVRGAKITHSPYYGYGSGLTPAQLYSTASYAAHDLTGISLEGNSLAGVNLADQNLTDASFENAALSGANLSQANLTYANFYAATLTGANLTGAVVRGGYFSDAVLSTAQLYSTASYQAHDLRELVLHGNYPGINLAGQNLVGASFSEGADLSDANFSKADLTHVFFVGTKLTNANFSGANLTDGSIGDMVAGADFSNAVIRGATVWGLSKAQIYSTASYQTGDLTGIYLYSSQTNWNFAGKNLTGAEFQSAVDMSNSSFAGADLTDAYLSYVSFQNANFSNADLTGADLSYGKLTGANFTGADVRGARISREFTYPGSGISISQLASTASYQAHDLTGIRLRGNVLTNANLANQNLTDADFVGASLVGANLTGAEVRGALFHLHPSGQGGGLTAAQLQSTASYQAHDLSGIGLGGNNLAGANLVGQNLTNADFESALYGANLNGADLSQANLTNARLGNSTLTGATLVGATLANLDLHLTELGNSNLRDANLSASNFGGYVIVISGGDEGGGGYFNFPGTNLTGANLSGANLANANFAGTLDFFGAPFPGANLTNANLDGADARGANFFATTMAGASVTNLIESHGHIAGLDLTAGKTLVVRDYERFLVDAVPIVVDQQLAMDASGALRLVFDADPWGSTISFAPGISVARSGALELVFASGVDAVSQLGRTIDLFDWTGVTPTGAFNVLSPYGWDVSKLYTTGEVTLTSAAGIFQGDFNGDSVVNATDLAQWQGDFGVNNQSDADRDGDTDGADFLAWQRRLASPPSVAAPAAAPEPSAAILAFAGFLAGCSLFRINVLPWHNSTQIEFAR